MSRWSWSAAGAAFLANSLIAAVLALIETTLSGRANVGVRAGAGDLLYGVNAHLVLALVVTFLLRLALWRASDRRFAWIAPAGLLAVELGLVGGYWVGRMNFVPHFHLPAGKLVTAAIVAGGALAGLALGRVLGPLLATQRWSAATQRRCGTIGIILTTALLAGNAVALWSARPRAHAFGARRDATRGPRPHVIVMLVDTLRRDHLSGFGYDRATSPHLDRLMDESWVYENAYTPSTWTIPSVASIFTGLYPSAHGVTSALQGIPETAPTLAEHFRSYGYRTAAFVGNPILTGRNGYAQGFHHYFPADPPWWSYHSRTAFERIVTQLRRPGTEGLAWKLAEEALAWLDDHAGQPCFVYLHFMEPHSPYTPSPWHRREVAGDAPPGPAEPPRLHDHLGAVTDPDCHDWECVADPPRLEPEKLTGMVANYDGEIHMLDGGIESFLIGLRTRGLLDESHVVFCTDHGEEFFDHRGWYHGNSIYEEMIACPLAYRPPGGVAGGRVVERPTALLDMFATLPLMLGMELPPLHQGRPLPELIDGAPAPRVFPVLSEAPEHLYALRLRQWKLIRRGSLRSPDWRLFDLGRDPGETQNLAAALPDTLAELRGYLDGLVAQYAQSSLGEVSTTTDPELLERLRGLGYIQ